LKLREELPQLKTNVFRFYLRTEQKRGHEILAAVSVKQSSILSVPHDGSPVKNLPSAGAAGFQ
jgi:hypothetical protein